MLPFILVLNPAENMLKLTESLKKSIFLEKKLQKFQTFGKNCKSFNVFGKNCKKFKFFAFKCKCKLRLLKYHGFGQFLLLLI